jgi:hypothetical protein
MVDDTILGPLAAILPVRPTIFKDTPAHLTEPGSVSVAVTENENDQAPPPARRANPYMLFLILILLLASQGQLALKRGAKPNNHSESGID